MLLLCRSLQMNYSMRWRNMFPIFKLHTKWMPVRKLVIVFQIVMFWIVTYKKVQYKYEIISKLVIVVIDWPQVFNDSLARNDWNWSHQYGIDELCEVIYFKTFFQPIHNLPHFIISPHKFIKMIFHKICFQIMITNLREIYTEANIMKAMEGKVCYNKDCTWKTNESNSTSYNIFFFELYHSIEF